MLNKTKDGDITFTKDGVVFYTLDRCSAAEMSAYDLIVWENNVRRDIYERMNGYYSQHNEYKLIDVLSKRLKEKNLRPEEFSSLAAELKDTPAYYQKGRMKVIDV